MRRSLLPCLLALLMIATGCQSWNVNAFGVPVAETPCYATVGNTPRPIPRQLGHHAALEFGALTKEEKTATIVVIGVAIAAIVGAIIWVS